MAKLSRKEMQPDAVDGVDRPAYEDIASFSPMSAMADQAGPVHAIHQRFAEMLPHLPAAIEQADGVLKQFLESLLELLKK
jgi:hypothetical protein